MPVGEGQVETVAHDGSGGVDVGSRDDVLGRAGRKGGADAGGGGGGGGLGRCCRCCCRCLPPPPSLSSISLCVQAASRSAARDELQK